MPDFESIMIGEDLPEFFQWDETWDTPTEIVQGGNRGWEI